MDKTASMRITQLVAINMDSKTMHKQADFREVVDSIKQHLKRNALTYTGGAVGAGLGAVSAIGGPWWKYLTNSAVGGAAGASLGHVGDRLRGLVKNLAEENNQLRKDLELVTTEAELANKQLESTPPTYQVDQSYIPQSMDDSKLIPKKYHVYPGKALEMGEILASK